MSLDSSAPATEQQFFAIFLDSLRLDAILDFDLYIEQGPEFILYRSARLPFTEKTRRMLLENNTTRLFVSTDSRQSYQHYLECNLPDIVQDSSIQESVRGSIVYDSAKFLVKDLFAKPSLVENVRRGQELIESTVSFILSSDSAISCLLQIMAFDYTTYTHSVNVCTLSLALAQFIGIRNPSELEALGTGALLHDIGKTRVGEPVLNKIEPLTPDELFLIKRHPQWGCELLQKSNLLAPESYYPIIQHHERMNGSGYPHGLGRNDIHLFGRITAIADAFDAMTTEKAYRHAIDSYPALKEMFAEEGAFDPELLSEFARMFGPSGLIDD
ncbi:MAG: HD domain-containing protein [candidate division Zixibacteria bacterium]|nr:HD domain-containing protein [candidate division Zixibacteria bacterium]